VCLMAFSVYSLLRDMTSVSKTLDQIPAKQVYIPQHVFAHESRRRVMYLVDASPRSKVPSGTRQKPAKQTFEVGMTTKEAKFAQAEVLPPRGSWTYASPHQGHESEQCEPVKDYQTSSYPNCNSMHEFDLIDRVSLRRRNENDNLAEIEPILQGYTRHNWKIPTEDCTYIAFKNLRINHPYTEENFERQRLDALAMERLIWSSHVIDIYGYCGQCVMTEHGDGGTLDDLINKWDISPREKLVHAVDLAQSVADLHDIDRDGTPSMVHRDLDVINFAIVRGKLKLNDFNLAWFLRWHNATKSTCGFPEEKVLRAGYRTANTRSPEELVGGLLSEKIDIYGIGALLFYMLTTSKMYFCQGGDYCFINNMLGDEAIQKLKIDGVSPKLPAHVENSADPEIAAIRAVIHQSITNDATARPTAQSIADSLRNSLALLESEHARLSCSAFSGFTRNQVEPKLTKSWHLSSPREARVYLVGLVRDASFISTDLFHKLVELNCKHGFGIHVVAESGKEHAIARYQERQSQYSRKLDDTCAPFVIIDEPDSLSKTSNHLDRVGRIAHLRDFQRDRLQLAFNGRATDSDVVILVDFDLFSIPSVDTITQEACNMIHRSDHDVVCAAGLMHRPYGYYDTFATILKPDTFVYPMRGRLMGSRRGENLALVRSDDLFGTVTQEHILAYFENKKYQTSHGAVPVKSCFGGMAFYRASKWFNPKCCYSMSTEQTKEYANKSDGRPCEHVVFHLCLSNNDASTEIVVQPKLRTLWDEPMEVGNQITSGHGIRGGLVTVSKRASEGSRLVSGEYSLRINETGKLVVECSTNAIPSTVLWSADINTDYFHNKWSSMFLVLEKNGNLRLIQQVQQVRMDLPPGMCKLVDATGTSCRVEVWSSGVIGPLGHYFLELDGNGSLRVIDRMSKVLWANDGAYSR